MQLSAKEICVLQRLKSVERTNEDIIKAVKAEAIEVEAVKTDIYAGIPDLPASYKPTFIRRMESTQNENGEEQRKALFAMEIKVAKDKKTGESTVLSSIPVSSAELKDTGVKVYDDGRKSVYAMDREGNVTQNGVDTLAPVEVEDLLRKATEKSSQFPTEYHEPVYSTQYSNVSSYGQISPRTNGHHSPLQEINGNVHGQTVFSKSIMNGTKTGETQSYPDISRQISQTRESVEEPKNSLSTSSGLKQSQQAIEEKKELYSKPTDNSHQAMSTDSGYTTEHPSSAYEEDTRYSIIHATPCIVDDSEPVTMIFMGYQHADESDAKPISDYEGIIRAELVIIDDDNEEEIKLDEENVTKEISIPPIAQRKQILQNDTQNITVQKLPN
ncbi:palmdelphin-like [Bombina bombina]|uniref:palmdelphin-like n=1 Tax=Bombina bombina TaxID=8345 RepID=UPI00235ACC11|nr:palmdelphin-like [Bombina bombina]XP_053569026.1 palmdelphin-like [Bombina bombina]